MIGNSLFWAQLILFFAIVLIVVSGREVYAQRRDIGRRLKEKLASATAIQNDLSLSVDDDVLKRYAKYLTPSNEEQLTKVRQALIRAGYRKPSAVRMYYAYRIFLSVGLLLIGSIILPIVMADMPTYIILATLLFMMLMGYFAPGFWIERKYQYRKQAIQDTFPDALDLLLVCVEAGHGFDQALNRVVKELEITSSVLSDELSVVAVELRVGKDRSRVLRDFAERSGIEDINSFISVIKQADKYGVSIAEALRVYSAEMRDKRYMRVEEKANMMPVKLALGAILFTVPPVILILIGPSILMVARQLGGLL